MFEKDGLDITKIKDRVYLKEWLKWITSDPNELSGHLEDYSDEGLIEVLNDETIAVREDPNGYQIVVAHSAGGYEGGGEDAEVVWAIVHKESAMAETHNCVSFFPNAIAHIRFSGFYQSYDGVTWNLEFEYVTPNIVSTVIFG